MSPSVTKGSLDELLNVLSSCLYALQAILSPNCSHSVITCRMLWILPARITHQRPETRASDVHLGCSSPLARCSTGRPVSTYCANVAAFACAADSQTMCSISTTIRGPRRRNGSHTHVTLPNASAPRLALYMHLHEAPRNTSLVVTMRYSPLQALTDLASFRRQQLAQHYKTSLNLENLIRIQRQGIV